MSVIADIFAAVRLNLETGQFEVDAEKAAGTVGASMGKKLSSTLKNAAAAGIGALAGAGLAAALSGALRLNELAGEYQVQTGANADEAKKFSGVLNDLFKTSHQGYDEIAGTLIGLKTHFNLAGDAAKELAANILDFAEITGGTGTEAVERLNSLVKTGVIAEADMGVTMDKLTIAHQRWGGSINEVMDALTKFAPAMNALGMSTDEAISWMTIFNKAGVDSQRVVMGFNTAMAKVKSPEEFKQLVAQIAATPDDFKRSELAVDLFGKRAGSALANMLRPGTESIADMTSIIGTDYTGAVTKAAAVNDNTFGGRALLMLHNFQGTLAGLAGSLGTSSDAILMAFALLGPKLAGVFLTIGGGLGGLLTKSIVGTLGADVMPWMTTGTKLGTIMGTTMGVAAAAAFALAPLAVLTVGLKIGGDVNDQGAALVTQANEFVKTVSDKDLANSIAGVRKQLDGMVFNTYDSKNKVIDVLNVLIAESNKRATAAGAAVGVGLSSPPALVAVAEGTSRVLKAVADGVKPLLPRMTADGVDAAIAFGKGVATAAGDVVSAGNTLMNALHTPLDLAKVKTMLAGALHAKALVDGLNAGDPAVRGAAAQEAINILTYLDALKGPAYVAGQNAAWSLASGLQETAKTFSGNALLGPIFAGMANTVSGAIYSVLPTYQQQVAKIAGGVGTTAGNAALEETIKLLSGEGVNAADRFAKATGGVGSAATDAKAKLKTLADDAKTNLGSAFDRLTAAAHTFFDSLHERNLKAIEDTRSLANAQLDAQISGINAEVDAARKALADVQDARQLASLQAAVGSATDPASAASAQQALSDYLAQKNIDRLAADAKVKTDALALQQKANDDLAKVATTNEDARFKAQTTAYDKEMKALQTYLDKHPAAWQSTNAKVLALINAQAPTFETAGAGLGRQFTDGLKGYTSALVKAETTFSITTIKAAAKAAGGPVSSGMPYLVGERGAELFVPDRSGSIVPSGASGGLTINGGITISAGSLAGTEAEARAFARSIYDHLDDEARRRGLTLARAG